MKPLWWMVAASLGGWLTLTLAAPTPANPEAFFGMIGPLASASATWVIAARTYASRPERLTHVMLTGFAVKFVLFAAYLVVALRVLDLRPTVFVASFAGFFIALHVTEAWFLKQLFVSGSRAVPRE